MRKLKLSGALVGALLLVGGPATAKGDFFEYRITGPGIAGAAIVRLAPSSWGTPASPLPPSARPRYSISVLLGFNSEPRLIPMDWRIDYFPAVDPREARVAVEESRGEERWYMPEEPLRQALDEMVPFRFHRSTVISTSATSPAWFAVAGVPLLAVIVLVRRGRLTNGKLFARARPA